MAQGFGALNLGGTAVQAPQPKDPTEYLKQIAEDIRAIKEEYVTPPLFQKLLIKGLALDGLTSVLDSQTQPVARIYIQVFTSGQILSIFFTDSADVNTTPDLQITANPFPTVIPFPNIPCKIMGRNDSTTGSLDASIIISSAGG